MDELCGDMHQIVVDAEVFEVAVPVLLDLELATNQPGSILEVHGVLNVENAAKLLKAWKERDGLQL